MAVQVFHNSCKKNVNVAKIQPSLIQPYYAVNMNSLTIRHGNQLMNKHFVETWQKNLKFNANFVNNSHTIEEYTQQEK